VVVQAGGMEVAHRVQPAAQMGKFALLEAELKTGRTHQIRVHLASSGFPILGDEKYGDFALNKQLQKADRDARRAASACSCTPTRSRSRIPKPASR
jgi:23S rRNA pseudouridine955/2504/2580 synthase